MKFAIHGREFKPDATEDVQEVFDELRKNDFPIQISDSFARILTASGVRFEAAGYYTSRNEIFDADIVFSLGGDGTFLETLSHVGDRELPILGINFGRLGFLTSVQPKDFRKTLGKIINRQYKIDERTMVNADSKIELFEKGTNFALNEIAISKTDTSSMIIIHAYINGEFLNSYWADGLMVATSTGSTGYNLSCGGPLVMPYSDNFIITPICPHNLFVRPIVVSSESKITLSVESRSNNYLVSMDARAKVIGNVEAEIHIEKEKFKARLVSVEGDDFLGTLREKLSWGKDVRNRV